MSNVTLQMVRGATYAAPSIFGDRVVTKGEQVVVSEEHARVLLADFYYDKANSQVSYFQRVKSVDVEDDDSEDEAETSVKAKAPAKAPAKSGSATKTATRSRSSAKTTG